MTGAADRARVWARGVYTTEAGVELLIRSGRLSDGAPWVLIDGGVDLDALVHASGAWSGGEQRIVRIATSLVGGEPVDLSENLPGLDHDMTILVLAAVSHAAGAGQFAEPVFDDAGTFRGFESLPNPFPWPERADSV